MVLTRAHRHQPDTGQTLCRPLGGKSNTPYFLADVPNVGDGKYNKLSWLHPPLRAAKRGKASAGRLKSPIWGGRSWLYRALSWKPGTCSVGTVSIVGVT